MLDTTDYQKKFFSLLENEYPLLVVLESSDVKRTSFLNEVVEIMEKHSAPAFFRLKASDVMDFNQLVDYITERFSIPVRSINVGLLNQLKDQVDILRQMKQRFVLLVENAHLISHKNLVFFLQLAASQKRFSAVSIVLLAKPSLEKRLIQSNQFLEDLTPEILFLSSSDPLPLRTQRNNNWGELLQKLITFVVKKRVRFISIIALILFGVFLWQFEKTQFSSVSPLNVPISDSLEPKSKELPNLPPPALIPTKN